MSSRLSKRDRNAALSRINSSLCQLLSDINEVESETPGFTAPQGCVGLAHQINKLLTEAMKEK